MATFDVVFTSCYTSFLFVFPTPTFYQMELSFSIRCKSNTHSAIKNDLYQRTVIHPFEAFFPCKRPRHACALFSFFSFPSEFIIYLSIELTLIGIYAFSERFSTSHQQPSFYINYMFFTFRNRNHQNNDTLVCFVHGDV